MIKLLIVEDDILFAQTLEDFLSEEGFHVTLCHNGTEAETYCYENRYDLLLLDINMPGLSGLELLDALRKSENKTPAIYLTSYKDKETLLKGFETGADDYLKKPIDLDELLMRIYALLKRTSKRLSRVNIGKFSYDRSQQILFEKEKHFPLSKKLTSLLDILTEDPNSVVSKEKIKEHLWEWDENPSDGALRVYINELKKILGKEHIENIKGIGYRLAI
jgi:DNA-binding response OmpR family regulator